MKSSKQINIDFFVFRGVDGLGPDATYAIEYSGDCVVGGYRIEGPEKYDKIRPAGAYQKFLNTVDNAILQKHWAKRIEAYRAPVWGETLGDEEEKTAKKEYGLNGSWAKDFAQLAEFIKDADNAFKTSFLDKEDNGGIVLLSQEYRRGEYPIASERDWPDRNKTWHLQQSSRTYRLVLRVLYSAVSQPLYDDLKNRIGGNDFYGDLENWLRYIPFEYKIKTSDVENSNFTFPNWMHNLPSLMPADLVDGNTSGTHLFVSQTLTRTSYVNFLNDEHKQNIKGEADTKQPWQLVPLDIKKWLYVGGMEQKGERLVGKLLKKCYQWQGKRNKDTYLEEKIKPLNIEHAQIRKGSYLKEIKAIDSNPVVGIKGTKKNCQHFQDFLRRRKKRPDLANLLYHDDGYIKSKADPNTIIPKKS